MIYTPKLKASIDSIRPPHEFVIDIVEYNLPGNDFLGIRFYESQWEYYNEKERLDCLLYLSKVRDIIRSFGIQVTLEPVIDTGNNLPTKKKVRGKGVSK